MSNQLMVGIDCGASKVMVQSGFYNPTKKTISPSDLHFEYSYSDHHLWNTNFIPKNLDIQHQELTEKSINLTPEEQVQGNVIIETIQKAISAPGLTLAGLCFPGLKNNKGVVIMANGPRIPNMVERLNNIVIYNDSECCVLGERWSTIGHMNKTENALYIGGGTGIADGLIMNSRIINLSGDSSIKRSWELKFYDESVESYLSPAGILKHHNTQFKSSISTLSELAISKDGMHTFNKALDAFSYLLNDRIKIFDTNNLKIEKIIIGQRLGEFLKKDINHLGQLFKERTKIPIKYSSDRRTASLGAIWKKYASKR